MTRDDVQRWLDAYVEAWKTYDPEKVNALFAANVEYRYHPYDEPLRGREAVAASWLDEPNRDAPGTYEAAYEPFAVDGDTAVAIGSSRYYTDASKSSLDKEYFNAYLLRFDRDGKCASCTEYFMLRPGSAL
jgi:ketosteroid isomerase-like protein